VVPVELKAIRRKLAAVLLVVAISLAVIGLALLREVSTNSDDASRLYENILLVSSAGVALLLVMIGTNFVRLVIDLRRQLPGARLKGRLVGAFVALLVAPLAVVYIYSIYFLNQGIDSWFDVTIEDGLDDALALSRSALDIRMLDNLARTQAIADALERTGNLDDYYNLLPRLRADSGAQELSLFAGRTRIIATSSENPTGQLPAMPTDEVLLSLRRDSTYVAMEPLANDQYQVRTAVLMSSGSERDRLILQALYPLGKSLGPLTNSVQDTVTRYAELSFLRDPLKTGFIITLSMVVLLSLLLAVYAAFFVARRLSEPVQNLVAGTRAVAKGDFDTRLPAGERDEIGFLIDSFNDMIEQLAAARAEARRNEAQVENERANVEAILARLSTGVIALEKNLTIRTANQSAEELLNQPFRGNEGRFIEILASQNPALKQIVDTLQKHLEQGETEWREQLKVSMESGGREIVCSCTALPGTFRSRGGFVLVLDDITELLQAQRNAAWGEVARRLAHEIKNPLTPIQLSAERIRKKIMNSIDPVSGELLNRATQTIVQQVEAMRDMVNAFSEYARAPEMNLTALDLNALIRQIADLYPAQPRQPAVRLELDENLPLISVDAVRMRQVLHNLIRNSLEALENQADAVVQISTAKAIHKKGSWIQILVEDNGPGLSTESRDKIFEPYVTTKAKGTGLGLAIVKKLVEEHGGEVTIDSEAGVGTCVRILLRVARSGTRQASADIADSSRSQSA
jgi:nitrogen fixation/metabolism regulation signal transduction histidine kinase